VHLLALSNGQRLGFEMVSRQPLVAFLERHGDSPHQPFLQDADATKTPLV
jgi:hypothetical protein